MAMASLSAKGTGGISVEPDGSMFMTGSPNTALCPKCGRPLAANAPRGLCRKCLVSAILVGDGAGHLVAAPKKLTLPCLFGTYELLEEVARGGMGIVYKARQAQVSRIVALKVMAAGQFAEPNFVRRFRTESEAVAKLDHPNIVPIYEVGEWEGQPFFSMKFAERGTLLQHIADRQSRCSNREAAELVAKLARAVHFAHQRSILHRDIKPANVLIDAHGEPMLTDFGLARLVEQDSTLTRTMAMLGTPSYMSPEQARGESKQLTTAVDVYGLGAVFYQVLTGQPPFAGGTTMETVRLVLDTEPRRPRSVHSDVDRDLETICLKCLAKEASRRYGSAEALAHDLERWLRHEPILARPVSGGERLAKLIRRNPVATFFCAVTLIIIAASVFVLARANVQIRQAQRNEASLRGRAERRAEESRQQLVRLHVSAGNRLVDEGDGFRGLLWFAEALRLDNDDPVRSDVHRRRIAAVLRQSPELERLWFQDGYVKSAHFSPGGDRVISSGMGSNVYVWDVATGKAALPPLRHRSDVRQARFTPDGKRVFSVDAQRVLRFWDPATGLLMNEPLQTAAYQAISFSPDGRWRAVLMPAGVQLDHAPNETLGPLLAGTNQIDAAYFSSDNRYLIAKGLRELDIWDLSSDPPSVKSVRHREPIRTLANSHDGQTVAVTTARALHVWELQSGLPARSPIPLQSDSFDCRYSNDDQRIAVASWDGSIRIFDPEIGVPVVDALRHRAGASQCSFSPDGLQLATASWDSTARIWNPLTGQAGSPFLPHGGYVSVASFSPDGGRLVTAGQDQTVRLWNLRGQQGPRVRWRLEKWIIGLDFSRDGRRLLTCMADGRASLWDTRDGRLLVTLPAVRGGISHGCLSPDGAWVATSGEDGRVRVCNSATGEQIAMTSRHAQRVVRVFFAPDSQRIVSASYDGTACVWNATNGAPLTPMLRHGGRVVHAAFSPDGRRVLTASTDRTAQLWDAQSGERIGPAMNHPSELYHANFSPDGSRIVTACVDRLDLPRAALMWDAKTSRPLGPELPHFDGVLCAQFSPDGRYIATGGEDRTGVIWNAATGVRVAQTPLQPSYVTHAQFSPDSRFLLTLAGPGSDPPAARVWECETGEPMTPLLIHSAGPSICAWHPNGREFAVGAFDGSVSLWDLSPVEGSVEMLRRQAEVLSAHRIEPGQGLMPLPANEMQANWEALHAASSR